MKRNSFKLGVFALSMSMLFAACEKDPETPDDHDHDHEHEGELITTLNVNVTDNANNTYVFSFNDVDGEGGNDAVIDTISLPFDGAPFEVSLEVLDASDPDDVEDITAEIMEEDDEHLFCFDPTSSSLNVTVTDTDDNNLPVGLESVWSATDGVSGSLTITLKHQPGVKDGSCAPGDTDVEAVFPISIN